MKTSDRGLLRQLLLAGELWSIPAATNYVRTCNKLSARKLSNQFHFLRMDQSDRDILRFIEERVRSNEINIIANRHSLVEAGLINELLPGGQASADLFFVVENDGCVSVSNFTSEWRRPRLPEIDAEYLASEYWRTSLERADALAELRNPWLHLADCARYVVMIRSGKIAAQTLDQKYVAAPRKVLGLAFGNDSDNLRKEALAALAAAKNDLRQWLMTDKMRAMSSGPIPAHTWAQHPINWQKSTLGSHTHIVVERAEIDRLLNPAQPSSVKAATARDEAKAVMDVAEALRRNPELVKAAARKIARTGRKVTNYGFDSRVWPRAREQAGLGPAAPGRKKINQSIE